MLLIPILWRLQAARRQHSKKRQTSPFNCRSDGPGPCSAALPSAQSSYHDENWLPIRGVLRHRIHAKISPKAASEKAQTTVSGNRYTNPIIDGFRTVVLSLLASTGNSLRAPFLVYQVPRISATVWRYCRVFTQFSLRVRVSDYTWRPMIAGPLYVSVMLRNVNSRSRSKFKFVLAPGAWYLIRALHDDIGTTFLGDGGEHSWPFAMYVFAEPSP